ncbi:MAG: hypothetical protein Q9171_006926 [Xanthocarpia ochracea]
MGKQRHKKHQPLPLGELAPTEVISLTAKDGPSLRTVQSFQYSQVPLYAPAPDHPPLEPPTDHPVEKDDDEVAKGEDGDPPAEASNPPAEEDVPSDETATTSEAPQNAPPDEPPVEEAPTAEPVPDGEPPVNSEGEVLGADEEVQESGEGSGDQEPTANTAPTDIPVDDGGNGQGENGLKEADFPPIEPGEVEGDSKADEPAVNHWAGY